MQKPKRGGLVLSGFVEGLRALLGGFGFLCRHPSLWKFSLYIALITVLVAAGVWVGMLYASRAVINWIIADFPDAWYTTLLEIITYVCVTITAIGVGIIAYLCVQSILISNALATLTQKVERILGLPDSEMQNISWQAQVLDAIRASLKLGVINFGLLLLNVIPGVGSLAALVIGLYLDSYILGVEYLSYPMEIRGKRWLARQEFCKQNLSATLGLGFVMTFLLLTPIVGPLLFPSAIAGSVLLYRRLEQTDANGTKESQPMNEDDNVTAAESTSDPTTSGPTH